MTNLDKNHILNLKEMLAAPGYYYSAGTSQSGTLYVELDKNRKVQAVYYGNFALPFETFVASNNGLKLHYKSPKILGMELIND